MMNEANSGVEEGIEITDVTTEKVPLGSVQEGGPIVTTTTTTPDDDVESQTTGPGVTAATGHVSLTPSPIDTAKEGSVRFRPDMMYSRRNVVSRRHVFEKAQSVISRKNVEKGNAGDPTEPESDDPSNKQQQQQQLPKNTLSTYKTSRECYVQVVTGLKEAMDPKLRRRKEFGKRTVEDLDETMTTATTLLGPHTQYRLLTVGGQTREQVSYDPTKGGVLSKLGFNSYVHWSYKTNFINVFLSLTMIFFVLTTFFGLLIYVIGMMQPECLYVGSLDRDFQQAGSFFVDAFAISWTTFSTVGYGITAPQLSLNKTNRCILVNMLTAMEAFLGVLFAAFAGAVVLGKITRYTAVAPVTWSEPLVLKYGSGVKIETKEYNKRPYTDHSGDEENGKENDVSDEDDEDDNVECGLPFPMLEFRVANYAFARDGGELANVSVSAWARILARNATKELRDAARMTGMDYRRLRRLRRERQKEDQNRKGMRNVLKHVGGKAANVRKKVAVGASGVGKKVRGITAVPEDKGADASIAGKKETIAGTAIKAEIISADDSVISQTSSGDLLDRMESAIPSGRSRPPLVPQFGRTSLNDVTFPTVPVADIVSPQSSPGVVLMDDGEHAEKRGLSHPTIYSRLALETESHPFLKRCWHLRHQIDEHSPLLDCDAHEILRKFRDGGGKGWPPQLNCHEKLRKHICFEEISVTLSGTDHVTGNTVYGTSIYTTVDLAVGYRFANCLMMNPKTGLVGIDLSLINDVLEQHGGGGEPLIDEEESTTEPPVESVKFRTSPALIDKNGARMIVKED